MTKFGTLLGFKPAAAEKSPKPAATGAAATDQAAPDTAAPDKPDKNVIELDQELFFPIASQLGEENETVRNLLIDAEHKISELDTIKRSIGKLVDPVSKTLRAFEETKNQKIALQGALNNTRIACEKQRTEIAALQTKAASYESECTNLRDVLSIKQQKVATLESTKAELTAELTTRRAQVTDLQNTLHQQATDLQMTRDENRRLAERIAIIDKRLVTLEAETSAAQQKLQLAERERSTVHAMLEKSLNEAAQLSSKLLSAETLLSSTQSRLSQTEAAFTEAQSERIRLASALSEATEKHRTEMISQNARFQALDARAGLSDQLLEETRQALAARSDEVGAFDRRVADATLSREAAEGRLSRAEAALAERDTRIRELQTACAKLTEHNATLTQAIETGETAFTRAQEKIQSQDDLIQLLEHQLCAIREASDLQVQELSSQLQREQLERSMADGAVEAGRKDIARLLRELSTLQYHAPAAANDLPSEPPLRAIQSAA